MMPMPLRRKARNMEKVEILCRTATAEDRANTSQQIRSRLRARCATAPPTQSRCGEHPPAEPVILSLRARQPFGRIAALPDTLAGYLPDMSHFAAEFYEYCAKPAGRFQARESLAASAPTFLRCSVAGFRVVRSH
jgi:hypothetical protein